MKLLGFEWIKQVLNRVPKAREAPAGIASVPHHVPPFSMGQSKGSPSSEH
jgi:hypothetical protein